MRYMNRKSIIFVFSIIFAIFGICGAVICIKIAIEPLYSATPFNFVYGLVLTAMSLLVAFGCWFYLKWTRIVAVMIPAIIIPYTVCFLIRDVINSFTIEWRNITHPNWERICIPATPSPDSTAIITIILLYASYFMFHKDTKLIFERKGNLDDIQETISKDRLFPKLLYIVIIVFVIYYIVPQLIDWVLPYFAK